MPNDSRAACNPNEKPIVFFDGVCGLCNRAVDLIVRIDPDRKFFLAPIQGETARRMLPPLPENPSEWSIIYVDEKGIHEQSDAAVEICLRLGGIWHVPALARYIPRGFRDTIYRLIARNRYRWFGKKQSCRIPTPRERERFLP